MKNYLLFAFMLTGFCVPGFSQETEHKFKEQLLAAISPEFEIAVYRFQDLNNDEHDELLVIGKQGQVKIWSYNLKEAAFEEVSSKLSLPFPNQSLLSLSSDCDSLP